MPDREELEQRVTNILDESWNEDHSLKQTNTDKGGDEL